MKISKAEILMTLRRLLIFAIMLTRFIVKGNIFTCENFECKNNGICKTVITKKEGNITKRAECVCRDRWIGPSCEASLVLSTTKITSYSVTLNISLLTNASADNVQGDIYLKYTLQYWSNKSDGSCYMLPETSNSAYDISDLESGTYYYFCARTDVDRCYTSWRDPKTFGLNCIGIVTADRSASVTNSIHPIIPIGIMLILLLIVILTIGVICCKNSSPVLSHCFTIILQNLCQKRSKKPAYDLFMLPDKVPVDNQTPLIPNRSMCQFKNEPHSTTAGCNDEKSIPLITVVELNSSEASQQNDDMQKRIVDTELM